MLFTTSCYQVMKENCTIAKPHLVENFVQDLMAEHAEMDDRITFTKVHNLKSQTQRRI